ncbi:MAG: outer membrane beta-barrel protein [Proteobacteria bacterium]|nr:outer membrane beta-barrel protein [Pseudomonadota bacterium]
MASDRLPVRIFLFGALAFFLVASLAPAPASAKDSSRLGQWDAYAFMERLGTGSAAGYPYPDIKYKEDNAFLYGVGFGKSFHPRFNAGAELYYSNPDLIGMVEDKNYSVTNKVRLIGGNVFVDFFLADWYIAPLITGSIGLTHYSSDVFDAPINSKDYRIETLRNKAFSDLDFTYSLGGGIRWDVTKRFMVKGVYQMTWRNLARETGPMTIEGYKIEAGIKF